MGKENIDSLKEFEIDDVLALTYKKRKVYHGEADFQFEIIETIKEYYKNGIVRAEHPYTIGGKRKYIDILVTDEKNEKGIAIEIKYKTKAEKIIIGSEIYNLKDHQALNDNSYFVVKDVEKIKNLVGKKLKGYNIEISKGYVIFYTNNSDYRDKKLSGKAEKFSLNKENENRTKKFNKVYYYYKKDNKTEKYEKINLENSDIDGEWSNITFEVSKKEHEFFELVFKINKRK